MESVLRLTPLCSPVSVFASYSNRSLATMSPMAFVTNERIPSATTLEISVVANSGTPGSEASGATVAT